jgi:hypothetical protein
MKIKRIICPLHKRSECGITFASNTFNVNVLLDGTILCGYKKTLQELIQEIEVATELTAYAFCSRCEDQTDGTYVLEDKTIKETEGADFVTDAVNHFKSQLNLKNA